MSLFYPVTATCSNCGTRTTVDLAASVNADRRPDLRAAIIDGSFQATDCPNCGTRLRLPAHLSYTDQGRGQWILVDAPEALANLDTVEDEAWTAFEDLYGPAASEAAQELGRDLTPRLVFGWPALREKLLCREYGLDDVGLELLKVAMLRNIKGAPLSDTTELRLTGRDDGTLGFAWLDSLTERQLSLVGVPQDVYDEIAAAESWAALRQQFDGRLFVDFKALLAA